MDFAQIFATQNSSCPVYCIFAGRTSQKKALGPLCWDEIGFAVAFIMKLKTVRKFCVKQVLQDYRNERSKEDYSVP